MLYSTGQSLRPQTSLPLFATVANSILGLTLLGVAGFALSHFPVARLYLAITLAGYACALWWQPRIWMLVIPALLPVLDLAPWSGWFFFDESDLFLAVTVAVGNVRTTGMKTRQRLHPVVGFLLALLSLSYAISAYIGLIPLPTLDANAFANYYSHFNSFRILKGFLWALLLLPLLRRALFENDRLDPYFVAGMASGLAGVTLAALWERWAFTGLLDFASDYRITATFSAMHTGGAALDGYLAMALPFTALLIFSPKNGWIQVLGLVLFITGLYASMVTFSRGLYLAIAFMALIMCIPRLAAAASGPRRNLRATLLRAGFLALIAVSLWNLFSTGGYRTLAAILGLFGAAFFVGTGSSPLRNRPLLLGAIPLFAGIGVLLALTVEKGAYVIFAAAAALFWIALPLAFSSRENLRHAGGALMTALYLAMAAGVLSIAKHWGGNAALSDAIWPVLLALVLPVLNRILMPPLWRQTRTHFSVFIVIGALLGVSIPVAGNYYMLVRMTRVQNDLSGRLAHWSSIYSMIDRDWQAQLFGMGLGKLPVNYFWKNPQHEFPGTYQFPTERDNIFLRLGGPQYSIGYGEVIRIGQRVVVYPGQKYTVEFDARSNFSRVQVAAELCEKLLLYPVNCVGTQVNVIDTKSGWRKIAISLDSKRLGDTPWHSRRPVQFSLSTPTSKAFVDIDNVRVIDAYGNNVLENADFSAANSHWFFTSDRHHLPWHAKNLWLHVLFEQGWVGLILFSCLLIFSLAYAATKAYQGKIGSAVLSASLCGFLVVGLFDSLLDVPRSTLMFFLLLMSSVFVSAEMKHRRRKGSKRKPSGVLS